MVTAFAAQKTDKVPDRVPDKVPDKVPDSLTENQQKILKLLEQNETVSMSQIAEKPWIN
jgi:ATP-dependent DNA helicase RecG